MLHPGSKCLFEPAKRTKHAASGPEMSFCNRQKDKTKHYSDEGQFDGSLLSILKNMRQLIFILLLVRVHCSMGV